MAGATLLAMTFAILVFYFVISTPLATLFTTLDDADMAEATDEMSIYIPYIRNAMTLAFSIAIITPAMIFIFWIFHREPDFYDRR